MGQGLAAALAPELLNSFKSSFDIPSDIGVLVLKKCKNYCCLCDARLLERGARASGQNKEKK